MALLAVCWVKVPQMGVFDVRQVAVTGTSAVPDLLVRRRIDPLLSGRTIFEVDTAAVEREVEDLPFVHKATVDRHLPGGLSLEVSEYEPLAFGMAGASGWLVARDGRVLVKARREDWGDRVPVVRLERESVKAGQRVGEEPALRLLRVTPETFPAAIRSVEITDYGLVVLLHQGLEVRFGRDENLRTKLLVAERLLVIFGPRRGEGMKYLDVSVPERPAICMDGDPCATLPPPEQVAAEARAEAARAAAAAGEPVPDEDAELAPGEEALAVEDDAGITAGGPGEQAEDPAVPRSAVARGESADADGGASAPGR